MRFLSVIVLAVAAGSSHAASQFSGAAEPGPHGVGLRVVQQYDDSRAYRGGYDLGARSHNMPADLDGIAAQVADIGFLIG